MSLVLLLDFLLSREAADQPKLPLPEQGKELFALKACNSCHSVDGSALVGPSLKGLAAHGSVQLQDGSSVEPDENYLRESILNPQAKIVAGFDTVPMPAFAGQLSEDELKALIAYIKTL